MPTSTDIAALQYELIADPLARGYASMTDAQIAASLNTVNLMNIASVPIASVEAYLLADGTLIRLENWLTANPTAGPLNTAVAALLRVIDSTRLDMFNISTPAAYQGFQQQLQALVTASLLTSQQASDLLNMTVTNVSRAQQIGWANGISITDIDAARMAITVTPT